MYIANLESATVQTKINELLNDTTINHNKKWNELYCFIKKDYNHYNFYYLITDDLSLGSNTIIDFNMDNVNKKLANIEYAIHSFNRMTYESLSKEIKLLKSGKNKDYGTSFFALTEFVINALKISSMLPLTNFNTNIGNQRDIIDYKVYKNGTIDFIVTDNQIKNINDYIIYITVNNSEHKKLKWEF